MILKRRMQAILIAGCAALLPGLVRAQQVVGSVESGLQTLAQEIVTKSVAQDRNSIAVLPFPNADGSCSVLSTYIADELIQALFSIPNSPLSIIERNQLEAIVNEIQIGAGGLLNPETTQSLGKVSGVRALTVGTITQIGDRVRINARLVATDTGRTISAAAISIPRTSDIDSLLRQPIAGEGGTCGVRISARAPAASPATTANSNTTTSSPGMTDPAMPNTNTIRSMVSEGLNIYTQQITRSPDKKTITILISLTNKSEKPMKIIIANPKPSILDEAANEAELTNMTGIDICQNGWRADTCKHAWDSNQWITLNPNIPVNAVFRFQNKDGIIGNKLVNFTTIMLRAPDRFSNNGPDNFAAISDVAITFSNLPITQAGK